MQFQHILVADLLLLGVLLDVPQSGKVVQNFPPRTFGDGWHIPAFLNGANLFQG